MTEEKKEEKKEVKTGLKTVTSDILDGESDVSEHVVNEPENIVQEGEGAEKAEDPGPSDEVDKYPGLTDKHGRPFDAKIHNFDDVAGFPKLNKTGKAKGKISIKKHVPKPGKKSKVARPKKPKPEPGAKKESLDQEHEKAKPATTAERRPTMQPEIAAKIAASITFKMGIALGGEEWEPQTDPKTGLNEAEFMTQAYQDYFEAKGVTDVSPGWILAIALTSYAAPRLTMPKTKTRLQRYSTGLQRSFRWIKSKLTGKPYYGTRSDLRNDRERKNHVIKEDSQGVEGSGPGRDRIRPAERPGMDS